MLQVLVSVLGGGGTRGQFSAHILPASCPLQNSLQATFQFLCRPGVKSLVLCNTYHWSPVPVRKCWYSLGDAVSVRLSVCSSLCANADLPASPISQVLITRRQSNHLCNHVRFLWSWNHLCKNPIQYPSTSHSSSVFFLCSFALTSFLEFAWDPTPLKALQ